MDKKNLDTTEPLDAKPGLQEDAMPAPRLRLQSAELFGSAREIVIEHAGQEYRLRLTRQGKLILTK
ncbi:MAG: hemin uptake protein HemP [Methylobacter sp.]